jgi:hypothetical protein
MEALGGVRPTQERSARCQTATRRISSRMVTSNAVRSLFSPAEATVEWTSLQGELERRFA